MLARFKFTFANRSRRIDAIHDRHLDVHQDNIEVNQLNDFKSLPAILDRCDLMAVFLKHADRQTLIDDIVLSQQNFQLTEIRTRFQIRTLIGIFRDRYPKAANNRIEQFRLFSRLHQPFRNPQLFP